MGDKARDYDALAQIVDSIPDGALPPLEAYDDEPQALRSTKRNGNGSHAGVAVQPPAAFVRRPMDWNALQDREPADRVWQISHWLTGGPALLAGSGGIGKTLLAQTVGTALALGRRFIDDIPQPLRVLFWACEDDHDELWRRQAAICRYFEVPLCDLQDKLVIEPRLGLDNTLFSQSFGAPGWTSLRNELASQCQDYKTDVLLLDNIGQTFGGSENDRHHVTAFVNGLSGIVTDRPFSTILLGHPSKQLGSEFSGSTAWENAVRMRWYMGAKLPDQEQDDGQIEDPNVRYLAKRKTNYTVKDYRKLSYQDGVFVPEGVGAPGGSFTDRYTFAQRQEETEETILWAIGELKAIQMSGRASPSSPDYLPKKMAQMKLSRGCADRELRDALNRLLLKQRVKEIEVGRLSNRLPRMGLVAA